MTAFGIALTGLGALLIWSGAKGEDVREVIKSVLTGKGVPAGKAGIPQSELDKQNNDRNTNRENQQADAEAQAKARENERVKEQQKQEAERQRERERNSGNLQAFQHPFIGNGE